MSAGNGTAEVEHRRRECAAHGHDWNVVTTKIGSEPTGVLCARCGASWSVSTATEGVGMDDAAIERVAAKLVEIQGYHVGPLDIDRRAARRLLDAARGVA